jgi:ATP-dependent Clp protease ATP-binding subunit ClpA
MSEFSEAHASVRLIGSPPGYVGYEEGGQLTNPVAQQPQSLILLDEIEKAHTKVFDLFLQILDDGRLTDSSGKTIDFRHTVVVATSNCASQEINRAIAQNVPIDTPDFFSSTLLPILSRQFRIEFLNRFDSILAFQPLSINHLVTIAQAELKNLESQLSDRKISFTVPSELLVKFISPHYQPMFGARPIRRIIAERFESPLVRYLLANPKTANLTITGDEPWLN